MKIARRYLEAVFIRLIHSAVLSRLLIKSRRYRQFCLLLNGKLFVCRSNILGLHFGVLRLPRLRVLWQSRTVLIWSPIAHDFFDSRFANSLFRSAVNFHHGFFGPPSMNRTAAMNVSSRHGSCRWPVIRQSSSYILYGSRPGKSLGNLVPNWRRSLAIERPMLGMSSNWEISVLDFFELFGFVVVFIKLCFCREMHAVHYFNSNLASVSPILSSFA